MTNFTWEVEKFLQVKIEFLSETVCHEHFHITKYYCTFLVTPFLSCVCSMYLVHLLQQEERLAYVPLICTNTFRFYNNIMSIAHRIRHCIHNFFTLVYPGKQTNYL